MRIIPGNTKVQIELFKGVSLWDMLVGAIGAILLALVAASTLPYKWIICGVLLVIDVLLLARIDKEPNYIYLINILRHFGFRRKFDRMKKDSELVEIADKGEQAVEFENLFPEESEAEEEAGELPQEETKAERKARLKAEKAEYKADQKLLKSKKLSKEEEDAIWLKRANQSAAKKQEKAAKGGKTVKSGTTGKTAKAAANENRANWAEMEELSSFSDIKDGFINYHGKYYGAALEIPAVEFRFYSNYRRNNAIENGLGAVLRSIRADYCMNLVKIERPVEYNHYVDLEYEKLEILRDSFEKGFLNEEELKARVAVVYDRLNGLLDLKDNNKVVIPFYYLVFFDSDKTQLKNQVDHMIDTLRVGEILAKRLNDKELALMLRYSNELDFEETDIEGVRPEDYATWAMPDSVQFKPRISIVNGMATHNFRVVTFPSVVGDAWLASLMTYPSTKVVVKMQPMDSAKSIRAIDKTLSELRATESHAKTDSEALAAHSHIESLQQLLTMLQNENETLLDVNVYVTAYDAVYTENSPKIPSLPNGSFRYRVAEMKKVVRRAWTEGGFRLNNMEFNQAIAYIGGQISGYDPMASKGRGIPSNTAAAMFPWIFPHIMDPKGVQLGSEDGVPVFIDFFTRNTERVNSNMVIVGKSGSGKSYATKALLTNLAADDAKIFILDPEDEYTDLAKNLHGKFINVATAQYGRLNPFHIITTLDDDVEGSATSSYATHLQFLEEFFKQILPDCDKDSLEYLNSLVDRIYKKKGINPDTDLSRLRPEDYPIFDDLYDEILREFQRSTNEYIRTMLRTLMNYVSKFSEGGRNSVIWDGPSTITTEENFTVFNFQSLLANRNTTIANAQMLLILKYIDNEIIKNRDYNEKYGMNRKIVVVIDEAHVFIDTKFPVALDFMFQLAKRIRKYNGMQIVITQNIKDFVGSEEIARKSTAIINACQYSFIFSLAPNDMDDLCKLYEKAGGINENEQEQIVQAQRGQAFVVMSPTSRSSFKVTVPPDTKALFSAANYVNPYFEGEGGPENWADYIEDSVEKREAALEARTKKLPDREEEPIRKAAAVIFDEVTEEEFELEQEALRKPAVTFEEELMSDIGTFDLAKELAAAGAGAGTETESPALNVSAVSAGPAVNPVPAAPVIVQAPAVSSRTEEILADLVDKLGTASMADEIRKAVREEVEREVAARMAAQGLPSAPAPAAPAPSAAPQETESAGKPLGNIFDFAGLDSLFAEEKPAEAKEQKETRENAPAESADDDAFDVLAFLSNAAAQVEELDDTVESFFKGTETTKKVTLEQLMSYNRKAAEQR